MVLKQYLAGLLVCLMLVCQAGCASVPITGRKQLVMISVSELNIQAKQSYRDILSKSKIANNQQESAMLKEVGAAIAAAAEDFLRGNGQSDKIRNYSWEFNLIDADDTLNAFCLPGGKVAVYTGIMRLARDKDALAVVVAHEIAHALANHGAERMTQMLLAQFGQKTLESAAKESSQKTKEFLDLAYGLGTKLGIVLPYSRLHENEADHIGLILMAKAGYDPRAAVVFWEKMQQKGNSAPEFLSTHPVAQTRINNIKALIPEALQYYGK